MCFEFHAHWVASADAPKKNVSVVISTTRREISPELILDENTDVCGVSAGTLAMMGEGRITSVMLGERSFLRVVPMNAPQLIR